MTIPNTTREITHIGTGAATVFTFPFTVIDATDLLVTLVSSTYGETVQVYLTDYTVSGLGDAAGSITMVTAPLAGYTLRIERVVPLTQETDIKNQSGFYPETIEDELDRLVMADQQQQAELDLALKLDRYTESGVSRILPAPDAGKILTWATDELSLVNSTLISTDSTLSGAQVVDHFTGGVDYTAGTTTSLSLSTSVGQRNATVVTFDGLVQHKNTYSITGSTINFTSPIPVGVLTVEVQTYQTMAIGVPPPGTDASTFLVTPTNSVRSRSLADRYADEINVQDLGATGDGVTDDSAAFLDAVATGKTVFIPPGTYLITATLNMTTTGQLVYGDSLGTSRLIIPATFGTSRVFNIDGITEPGPVFRDFAIEFEQPDTAVRASLVTYGAAFFVDKVARCRWERVRISNATTGIHMYDNCGGAYIESCEFSAYNNAVWLQVGARAFDPNDPNYCADSVRIQKTHFWVFGMTADNALIHNDGVAQSLYVEQCDDLNCVANIFYNAGTTVIAGFGAFACNDWDTAAPFIASGGLWSITSGLFSSAGPRRLVYVTNDAEVTISGVNVLFGNLDYSVSGAADAAQGLTTGQGAIEVDGTSTPSGEQRTKLTLTGCNFRWGAGAVAHLIKATAARIDVTGCDFAWLHTDWSSVTYPSPLAVVLLDGAVRATFTGITSRDTTAYVQSFVKATNTDSALIKLSNIICPGRFFDLPAHTSGSGQRNISLYQCQSGPNSGLVGSTTRVYGFSPVFTARQLYGGGEYTVVYTGTLSGGGGATFAHNIPSSVGQKCVIRVSAWYKGGSGEAVAITSIQVDGTNVILAGGGAAAAYRAYITFGDYEQAW